MNWEALGAIAEAGSAFALIVTLMYLALQIRYLKHQSVLASFQHTYDAINNFDDSIAQSEELASLIVRGRISAADLTPGEKLRFDHTFGRLLNIVESWYFQVVETSRSGPYREGQLRNIRRFVSTRCDYPGVLAFWAQYQHCYNEAMHTLIAENTGVAAVREQTPRPAPTAAAPGRQAASEP